MTPLRILLVEDSTLTTQQLNELLHTIDHDISISNVSTEREAIQVAQEWRPHVVIVDLRLRDGWGFNVLRNIVALDPKPFIVVLTNYALPQYREYALLIGADLFLDKALGFESLAKEVGNRAADLPDRDRPTAP